MLSRLLTLFAGLLLSVSASAGYVQYTFNNVLFDDGVVLEGFFIQNDVDKSIAYYYARSNGGPGPSVTFAPSNFDSNLESVHTHFAGPGPTSFTAFDNLSDAYFMLLNLEFSPVGSAGTYRVRGYHESFPLWEGPHYDMRHYLHTIVSGTLAVGEVGPAYAGAFESGYQIDGLNHFVPRFVPPAEIPEPSSVPLMLLAAGALVLSRAAAARSSCA